MANLKEAPKRASACSLCRSRKVKCTQLPSKVSMVHVRVVNVRYVSWSFDTSPVLTLATRYLGPSVYTPSLDEADERMTPLEPAG